MSSVYTKKERSYNIYDLEDILDSLPIAIWLKDRLGKYIYVNKYFCKIINKDINDILGKTDDDFGNPKMAHMFKCDDDKVFKNNTEQYTECKIIVHNTEHWTRTYKKPIIQSSTSKPALVAASRNISLQKRFSKNQFIKYSNLKNRLQLFLDTATDLYCIVDYNGKFKKTNNNFFKYLGWNESELSQLYYQDLIHPDDYEKSLKFRLNAQKNHVTKGYGLLNRFKCKNNDYKSFLWNWNLIPSENCILMTGKNITNEIRLEDEKALLKREYELETLKTNFFANISHEFRTPINIILTSIQLIKK